MLFRSERDSIYRDPAWSCHPIFRRLAQSHLAWSEALNRMIQPGGERQDWRNEARAKYVVDILTGALSPANSLTTNPVAIRKFIDTGGMSVLKGMRNWV